MSARDQVFALPELLGCILLELPMRDLLLDRRVCKTWQAAARSKPIQRKLFFQPMAGDEVPLHLAWVGGDQDGDDFLVNEMNSIWTRSNPDSVEQIPVPIYQNPVLAVLLTKMSRRTKKFGKSRKLLPRRWQRPDASWRRMLATQPSFAAEEFLIGFALAHELFGWECRWDCSADTEQSTAGTPKLPSNLGSMYDETIQTFKDCFAAHPLPNTAGSIYFSVEGVILWKDLYDEGWLSEVEGASLFDGYEAWKGY